MTSLAKILRRGVKRNTSRGGFLARAIRALVVSIDIGKITVVLPSGERVEHNGTKSGPSATIIIRKWRAISRLVTGGDLGFAEAYIDGDWTTPDLESFLEVAARNIAMLDGRISGYAAARLLNRLRHLFRANSKTGSRKNITYHYDLGNAFYKEWRVLEIGCGWGALAARLGHRGVRVFGVTLSSEQLEFATECIRAEELQETVSLQLKDYRDVAGTYDRIVSIEMLEAVGEAYWPVFFNMLWQRLQPDGRAVLQVITIDENRFAAYRGAADFIQRHVFPGGMLPTKSIIQAQAARVGLKLAQSEHFGMDYQRTLLEWRKRFLGAWPKIKAMGYSDEFYRLWDYYLCYCAAGFKAGTIDVGLYVFEKTET